MGTGFGIVLFRNQKLGSDILKDKVVESVIKKFKDRSKRGIEKYGTTLERDDLSMEDWLTHAQEEAMDFVLYLEAIKKRLS